MSELNDFIAAQHQTNIHLSEGMARVETLLAETNRRLFGGDGQQGALPYMIQEAKATVEEQRRRFDKIEIRTGALEGWKKSSLAWIGGAIALLTLEGTALALYFNEASGHITKVAGH
jgi:hypothetical protein